MKPVIREIDKKYIEVIGHYDNPVLCAKLTLIADMFAIEHKNGYAKFDIKDYDKLSFIDDRLEFSASISYSTTYTIDDTPDLTGTYNFPSAWGADLNYLRIGTSSGSLSSKIFYGESVSCTLSSSRGSKKGSYLYVGGDNGSLSNNCIAVSNSSSGTGGSSTSSTYFIGWVETYNISSASLKINSNSMSSTTFEKVRYLLKNNATNLDSIFPKTITKTNTFEIPETIYIHPNTPVTQSISYYLSYEDTYTISSSNTQVATVSIDNTNHIITITTVSTGTTNITITSTTDNTKTVTQQLAVEHYATGVLSNTTWKFNSSVELAPTKQINGEIIYNNITKYFKSFIGRYARIVIGTYDSDEYSTASVVIMYVLTTDMMYNALPSEIQDGEGWYCYNGNDYSQSFKLSEPPTVKFIDGTDISNDELITYLNSNAEQINLISPSSFNDISVTNDNGFINLRFKDVNYKLEKSSITTLAGTKWVLNRDILYAPSSQISFTINGKIDDVDFTVGAVSGDSSTSSAVLILAHNESGYVGIYMYHNNSIQYKHNATPNSIITFTDGTDIANTELINWLSKNATMVVEDNNVSDSSFNQIKINGNVLSINDFNYALSIIGESSVSDSNNSSFKSFNLTDNGDGTITLTLGDNSITVKEYVFGLQSSDNYTLIDANDNILLAKEESLWDYNLVGRTLYIENSRYEVNGSEVTLK